MLEAAWVGDQVVTTSDDRPDESAAERLLGRLLDESHTLPAEELLPLIADTATIIGGSDVRSTCRTTSSRHSCRYWSPASRSAVPSRLRAP